MIRRKRMMRHLQNPDAASLMLFAHLCRLESVRKGTGRHSGRDQPKGKGKGKRSPSREERMPSVEPVRRENVRPTQSSIRGYRLHTMTQGERVIVTQTDEIHDAGARGTSSRGPSQPADRRHSGGKGKRTESRNAEGRQTGKGKGKGKDTKPRRRTSP